MGTTVQFKVVDQDGNPIQGAKVEGQSNCFTFGGGQKFGGTTDGTGLTNYLETGCSLGGQATATASAVGFKSSSITFSIPACTIGTLCGNIKETITLNKVYIPPSGRSDGTIPSGISCPSGYVYDKSTGQCIKESGTTSYAMSSFFNTIKKNWLLIAVFIFIIIIAYIMIKRPDIIHKTTKSISEGVKGMIPK